MSEVILYAYLCTSYENKCLCLPSHRLIKCAHIHKPLVQYLEMNGVYFQFFTFVCFKKNIPFKMAKLHVTKMH